MVQPGKPGSKIPPTMEQVQPDPKASPSMVVQPADYKGKAVAAFPSEDPNFDDEFMYPTRERAFHSAPALYGHLGAHRPIKEPMRISPALAASLLKNPLPPTENNPSSLVPPPPPRSPATKPKRAARMKDSLKYPYATQKKEATSTTQASFGEEEEVNSYDNKGPGNHFADVAHRLYMKETALIQALTMDLHRECPPVTGFRDHLTSTLPIYASVYKNYVPMEPAPAPAHSGASSSSSNEDLDLDLELKL